MKSFQENNEIMKLFPAIALISCLLFSACSQKPKADTYTDTPTTGKVEIAVDETFQPIIEAELPVFHSMYKYATILPRYLPEAKVLNLLLTDSVRLAVLSRKLNAKELNYFHRKKFIPQQFPVAIDGIAVLVNPSNPDTLFSISQMRKIMLGEITEWKQLYSHSKLGKVKVVFDNPNSGIVRFVVDSITKTGKLGKQLSATTYNLDVIDFVSKNPDAIGLVGISWLSDSRDRKSLSFQKRVKVAGVSTDELATAENSFQPYQADLATGKYPLTRFVYMILTEPRAGLGTGFTSFVASDKGQRIMLKTGILPYTMPERVVNVKEE
jgi:phosphate transport system substrate-binding protein